MKIINRLTLMIITAFAVLSCENESNDKASVNDLSENAKNYFKMRNSNSVAQDGFSNSMRMGDPVNMSFHGLHNRALSMSAGRIADTDPWITCGQITTLNNDDGSTTTIYDYGDGCEEGKRWITGKYSYTSKDQYSNNGSVLKNTYYHQSSADNYGSRYYDNDTSSFIFNGSSFLEGEFEDDTTLHTYKGNYNSSYDYTYTLNLQPYAYKGISQTSYTEQRRVFEKNNYTYSNGSDYYNTEVLEPLVMLNCFNKPEGNDELSSSFYTWTNVSGREFVHYKQGDQEGSFEINYGNGACDNIIIIIENGKQIEVDLRKQPVFYW